MIRCAGKGPGRPTHENKADAVKESETLNQAVKHARTVAIVGGGIVGIELAGEITADCPTIQVVLIHNGKSLASPDALTEGSRNLVARRLKELGVDVVLGERVVLENIDAVSGKKSVLPGNAGYHIGSLKLKTESGKEIESGIFIFHI